MCGVVLAVGNNAVGSLCVRIKRKTNKADVVGVYYQPPSQNDDSDELLC